MDKRDTIKIGISGDIGSFSEKAARQYAGQQNGALKQNEIAYLISAEPVLAALERGEIDLAVFPIENSSGGMVKESLEAMSRHNFEIVEVMGIAVHQCILVMPEVRAEEITKVTSHVQALTQTRMATARLLPNAISEEYADTAKAAKDLAKGVLPRSTAVVASIEAANRYGLEVLFRNIEDLNFNTTNFIVARRRM